MELNTRVKEENKFWRDVYIAYIHNGGYVADASKAANKAVEDYRKFKNVEKC